MWLASPRRRPPTRSTTAYSGTLYRTTGPSFAAVPFDPTQVVATSVGTASVVFTDGNAGTFAYSVERRHRDEGDHAADFVDTRDRLPVTPKKNRRSLAGFRRLDATNGHAASADTSDAGATAGAASSGCSIAASGPSSFTRRRAV